MAMLSGSRPATSRRNSAGNNLIRDRFPFAPKITKTQGSILFIFLSSWFFGIAAFVASGNAGADDRRIAPG
jgi:hypothetical protein